MSSNFRAGSSRHRVILAFAHELLPANFQAGVIGCAMLMACMVSQPASAETVFSLPDAAPLLPPTTHGFVIAIDADADEVESFAATELKQYVKKIVGIDLVIERVETPPPAGFILGCGALSAAIGVDCSDLAPEEFVMRRLDAHVFLGGLDRQGSILTIFYESGAITPTLHAVYAFLEQFLDVRWLWPGEIGESWTPLTHVAVPLNLDVRDMPRFSHRQLEIMPLTPELRLFFRRNRLGTSQAVHHEHYWYKILPEQELLAQHPEYFALVSGVRGTRGGRPDWAHQVCTTNLEVAGYFVSHICNFFVTNASRRSLSLCPNDSGGFCECSTCQALDIRRDHEGRTNLSERMFTFFNEVAAGVAEAFPDRILSVYAYQNYEQVPLHRWVHPNIFVLDVYNFLSIFGWNSDHRRWVYQNIADWRAVTPNALFLSYFYPDAFGTYQIPGASSSILPRILDYLAQIQARGSIIALAGTFVTFGHDAWLFNRLSWHPTLDVETLLSEYYTRLVGPKAAPWVRRYHDAIERNLRNVGIHRPYARRYFSYQESLELFRNVLPEARFCLSEARDRVSPGPQATRLAMIQYNFDFLEKSLAVLSDVKRIDAALWPDIARIDAQLIKTALESLDERNRFLASTPQNFVGYAVNPGMVRAADRNLCTPFSGHRLEYLAKKHVPEARVPRIRSLSPSASDWATAEPWTPFVHPCTSLPVDVATEVRALYNQESLFFQITAQEPQPNQVLLDGVSTRDGDLSVDNSISVVLDVTRSRANYFLLSTNSLGTQLDQKRGPNGDLAWNGSWSVHIERDPQHWTATLAIPFATLGTDSPPPNSSWFVNVARQRRSDTIETSMWAPTFAGLYSPLYWGTVLFDE